MRRCLGTLEAGATYVDKGPQRGTNVTSTPTNVTSPLQGLENKQPTSK